MNNRPTFMYFFRMVPLVIVFTLSNFAEAARAATAPVAGGAPSASAPGSAIHTRHKALYVIALAGDPATITALVVETTLKLRPFLSKGYTSLDAAFTPFEKQICSTLPPNNCASTYPSKISTEIWLIPQPTWGVPDFVNQCQSDPEDTIGTLLIGAVENDSGNHNLVLWSYGYTNLAADAMFITCEPRSINEIEATTNGPVRAGIISVSSNKQITLPAFSQQTSITAISNRASPKAVPTTSRQKTWAARVEANTTTISTSYAPVPLPTSTPAINVIWDAGTQLSGRGTYGGVPFITIAGAGTYLASKTKSETTFDPPGCTGSSGANPCLVITRQSPTLPLGFAIFASSVQSLSTVTVPGSNPTRILRKSASDLAQHLKELLVRDCTNPGDSDTLWLCSRVFNFSQAPR